MSKIAAGLTRLLERRTATTIFIYIDKGLASNECWLLSSWGWQQRRVESISRNITRALRSQFIMPMEISVLLTLCTQIIIPSRMGKVARKVGP